MFCPRRPNRRNKDIEGFPVLVTPWILRVPSVRTVPTWPQVQQLRPHEDDHLLPNDYAAAYVDALNKSIVLEVKGKKVLIFKEHEHDGLLDSENQDFGTLFAK